jgi:hypothetical protein
VTEGGRPVRRYCRQSLPPGGAVERMGTAAPPKKTPRDVPRRFSFDRIVDLRAHLGDVFGSRALLAFDHVELNLLAFAQ